MKIFFNIFVKYFWQIAFAISLIVMFLMDTCRTPETITETITVINDTVIHDTSYVPVPYDTLIFLPGDTVYTIGDTVYIPDDVDTVAILKDYFKIFVYKDIIIDDTNAKITIADTISQNRILSRQIYSQFFPHVYHIKDNPIKKNIFYLGLGAGGFTDKFGVEGYIALKNKKDRIWLGSYDPINQYVRVGILFPIRPKKAWNNLFKKK